MTTREIAVHRHLGGECVRGICCTLMVVILCGGVAPQAAWAQDGFHSGHFLTSTVVGASSDMVSIPTADKSSIFAGSTISDDSSQRSNEQSGAKKSSGSGDGTAAVDQVPRAIDEAAYKQLFQNIGASFVNTSEEWKAMELAAIGQASTVNAEELEKVIAQEKLKPDTTSFQRGILAATAIGHVATAKDLVDTMAQTPSSQNMTNNQIFTLLSYACGPYEVPDNHVKSKEDLIDEVLRTQLPDGGFTFFGDHSDPDMTAMAIFCLEPLVSDETLTGRIQAQVTDSVASALQKLHFLQNNDGGFGVSFPEGKSQSNSNSTAMAVVALCSVGVDPASSWVSASGNTPLSALMSFASPDNKGFLYGGDLNDMSTEQGFRALVSYQGFKNTKGAYNIHTQAKLGQAALGADPDDNSDDNSDNVPDDNHDNNSDNNTPDNNPPDSNTPDSSIFDNSVADNPDNKAPTDKSSGNNTGDNLVKTGDGLGPLTQVALTLALGSLACVGVAWKRCRTSSRHKPIIKDAVQKD